MSDYTTNASVNLTMNGEQPKKVLEELRNRAFNLENAIAKAAKAGNKTELTKLRKELKTTQRQIREMESATMQVEKVLKQLDKATPKELQRTLKTLEKQLNNLERGSEEWKRQTEYIKRVRAELDKVNRELRNGETFWERFNRKMNDWQTTIAAGAAAVTGVVMAARSAVNAYADMDAEKALADFQYNAQLKKQQDLKKQQEAIKKSQDDLKNEYFGLNAKERKNAYDSDLANLKIVYEAELAATQGNAEERLRIEEAYQKAKLALQKKYGYLAVEDNRNALEKANAELAEWLESDAGKAVMQSFDTVMSGMGAIFSQVSSIVQAELEMQTASIEKRYDKEISLAEGNSYKVAKLEKQKEKEIAKAKNEANKKMFAMQVIQAVAQTATNAINAYGSAAAIPVVGFIMAPIAAAMAVAAGALQIAAIKKQQQASESQGYAKGGFTPKGAVDEEVGVVHAGEWVASQKLLANPIARPLINALDYAQRTNTIGSLRADDVSRTIIQTAQPQVVVQQVPVDNGIALSTLHTELSASIARLNERLNEPFVTVNTITGDNGIKKAQDEYDKLMRNKTPKSKRK